MSPAQPADVRFPSDYDGAAGCPARTTAVRLGARRTARCRARRTALLLDALRAARRRSSTTDLQIVQFRGQTGPFLEPAPGEASLNLLKMAREGLLYGLRTAVHASREGAGDPSARKGCGSRSTATAGRT